MTSPVTAAAERPIYFEGADGPVFAVLTSVADPVGNLVICSGGWHGGSTNANRMVVRLARRAAVAGRNVVRFDWHGAGESPGHIRFFRLDEPGTGDALGAVGAVPGGSELPTTLVGICIGTRAVLDAARAIPNLEAAALVSFPLPAARAKAKRAERIGAVSAVRQGLRPSVLRGWLQPATRRVYLKFLKLKWQSVLEKVRRKSATEQDPESARRAAASARDLDALVDELETFIDRGVRILFLFGDDDASYTHFAAARSGRLGTVLDRSSHVEVKLVAGDLSGFSSLEAQNALVEIVGDWVAKPAP
jgi:pimeloyl-ACP methyl ester carboxylesterase